MIPSFATRLQVALRCAVSGLPGISPVEPHSFIEITHEPPHSESLYRRLLASWIAEGVELGPIPARIQGVRTLALRHDIDQHPERSTIFLNIERELRVRGAYYFLADGCVPDFTYPYRLDRCKALVNTIVDAGGVLGLHSIAWAQSDGLAVFEREKERMLEATGFVPRVWTHHGFMNPGRTRFLRVKFELAYLRSRGQQFTQARAVVLSDSQGRRLPSHFPAQALLENFPNEFMTHSDYWVGSVQYQPEQDTVGCE